MDELMKMMAKKKMDGKMSEDEVKAKLDVIKELLGMADSHMGSQVKSGLDGMKKVSVMAPDSESLEAGLDKAQDLVGQMPEDDEEESDDDKAVEAMEDSPKEEASESEEEEKAEEAADPSPADEAMASVDDTYEDDMNPFNKKHKMMMEKKAKA